MKFIYIFFIFIGVVVAINSNHKVYGIGFPKQPKDSLVIDSLKVYESYLREVFQNKIENALPLVDYGFRTYESSLKVIDGYKYPYSKDYNYAIGIFYKLQNKPFLSNQHLLKFKNSLTKQSDIELYAHPQCCQ